MSLSLRSYQDPIFDDRSTGILILHWARQIGKSTVLAAWAADRLVSRPGRLVTVLSNSRENGAEFIAKAAAFCDRLGARYKIITESGVNVDSTRAEIRLSLRHNLSRLKVLPANPRTARGFSGDLILDEFAFHYDADAIWEAAEPILASNSDFLCRIASTGNGKTNMFYKLIASGAYPVSRVSRTDAWKLGVPIFDPVTRQSITPEQARSRAVDKIAYDQNYELSFAGGTAPLLSPELLDAAELVDCGFLCHNDWSLEAIHRLRSTSGCLYAGLDIGRSRDLTVLSVLEKWDGRLYLRALLRLSDLPFSVQLEKIKFIATLKNLAACYVDMTGLGLGLCESLCQEHPALFTGIHFASRTHYPNISESAVRITEALAIHLLSQFTSGKIHIPPSSELKATLSIPERAETPGQLVYTPRTAQGHADDFWSLALALWAERERGQPFSYQTFDLRELRGNKYIRL